MKGGAVLFKTLFDLLYRTVVGKHAFLLKAVQNCSEFYTSGNTGNTFEIPIVTPLHVVKHIVCCFVVFPPKLIR